MDILFLQRQDNHSHGILLIQGHHRFKSLQKHILVSIIQLEDAI